MNNLFRTCALVAFGLLLVDNSEAQVTQTDAQSAELEEIIVTARKRDELASDIGASLQVFGGDQLEEMAITRISDLQWVTPGLSVPGGGRGSIAIRGISNNVSGIGSDPSTAVHFDGIYLPRPSLVLLESYDLARIEVLKGPEGTLYGRNATAGVVNYVSESPGDQAGIRGFIGVGSFDLFRANVSADIPFGSSGGIRVSGAYSKDEGYTDIIDGATITPDLAFLAPFIEPGSPDIDNLDFQSFRIKGEFELSDQVSTTFSLQTISDNGLVGRAQSNNENTPSLSTFLGGGAQRLDPRTVSLDPVISRDLDGFLASIAFDATIGGLAFRSITGYVDYEDEIVNDNDGTGVYIERGFGTETSEFISQEFQVSGEFGESGFWTSGVYFSKEDLTQTAALVDSFDAPGDVLFARFSTQAESKSAAIFAEITFDLSPILSSTLGARYTTEDKSGIAEGENLSFATFTTIPYSGTSDIEDNAFTPKFALQYEPNDDQMWYLTITNGFKSGGYNPDSPVVSYDPEEIWAYEIGTKSSLANGNVTLTAAAFYYDYTDIQLRTAFFPPGGGAFVRITNAASAEITGFELGLNAQMSDTFSLDLGISNLSNSVSGYVPPGEVDELAIDMPLAPEWDGVVGLNFDTPVGGGKISARAEYTYRSEIIFSPNAQLIAREDSTGLFNANFRYDFPNDTWYIAAIGRNLSDETYQTNRFFFAGFADLETYAPPRQYELRIGASF